MEKKHGTRRCYNTGCRCTKCREANRAYIAQYRRDRPNNTQHAWRNNHRWEPWEDEIVGDYTKSAWQIADILERTPAAVTNRRRILGTRRKFMKENNK